MEITIDTYMTLIGIGGAAVTFILCAIRWIAMFFDKGYRKDFGQLTFELVIYPMLAFLFAGPLLVIVLVSSPAWMLMLILYAIRELRNKNTKNEL